MTLKTLGITTWDELEVGEIFANHGCWQIWIKQSEDKRDALCLADDYAKHFVCSSYNLVWERCNLYKLPKSVQRLWLQ